MSPWSLKSTKCFNIEWKDGCGGWKIVTMSPFSYIWFNVKNLKQSTPKQVKCFCPRSWHQRISFICKKKHFYVCECVCYQLIYLWPLNFLFEMQCSGSPSSWKTLWVLSQWNSPKTLWKVMIKDNFKKCLAMLRMGYIKNTKKN